MIWNSKVERVFTLVGFDVPSSNDNIDYQWYLKLLNYGKIIKDKLSLKLGRELSFYDADYFYHYVAIKEMNYSKLDRVIDSYKNTLNVNLPEEDYKWEAIKHFQNTWDINAVDFANMLSDAFSQAGNLLVGNWFFPLKMIKKYAELEPETVREMFKVLYDETKDLFERIVFFNSQSHELLFKYEENKSLNHFQEIRPISVYLTFRYPDKYYLYKANVFKKSSEFLEYDMGEIDKNISGIYKDSLMYQKYVSLCDKIIDHLKDREDVTNLAAEISAVTSVSYHMFAQDILYYLTNKYSEKRYWILAPNPGENKWQYFKDNNVIMIGWGEIGDIQEYGSKQAIADKLIETFGGQSAKTMDAKALYDFAYEMKVGDVVLIKNGKYNMYGYGIVKSDYGFDGKYSVREVEWVKTGDFDMIEHAPDGGFATKTLTEITQYSDGDWARRMIEHINGSVPLPPPPSKVNYYILSANPRIWRFSDCVVGETVVYTSYNDNGNKRKIYTNYENIKVGDRLIAYESTPVLAFVGFAEIVDKDENNNITIKKLENFNNPVYYHEIKEKEELANSEFIKNGQGSLFRLSSDEYNYLYDVIRELNPPVPTEPKEYYDREKFDQQVFLPMDVYDDIVSLLDRKRNVILQGPPGVGKTYMAKKIAYSIMKEKDDSRIKVVQFHQSYSYEDFIEGYKPTEKHFERKHGVFYKFCKDAENDSSRPYFFIIDEINRGNLSKIFGEILVLIEKDKRKNTKVDLVYSDSAFTIPENVYIIGMMNTADRSLTTMDYALRRRFSFVEIPPAFDTKKWIKYQEEINEPVLDELIDEIKKINEIIANDYTLTSDCMIGHSYFCFENNKVTKDLLRSIVKYEILPLLKEYYIDNENQYKTLSNRLLSIVE